MLEFMGIYITGELPMGIYILYFFYGVALFLGGKNLSQMYFLGVIQMPGILGSLHIPGIFAGIQGYKPLWTNLT